ncbi:hypothetical protein [Leptobacterium sp. I13]
MDFEKKIKKLEDEVEEVKSELEYANKKIKLIAMNIDRIIKLNNLEY